MLARPPRARRRTRRHASRPEPRRRFVAPTHTAAFLRVVGEAAVHDDRRNGSHSIIEENADAIAGELLRFLDELPPVDLTLIGATTSATRWADLPAHALDAASISAPRMQDLRGDDSRRACSRFPFGTPRRARRDRCVSRSRSSKARFLRRRPSACKRSKPEQELEPLAPGSAAERAKSATTTRLIGGSGPCSPRSTTS